MVPILETARLRLRGHRENDLGAHAAIMGDPEVVRFLGGNPLPREEAWRRMLAGAGVWSLIGYGYWAIERKEDGAYLGLAGFADFKRDMTPSIEGLPEMGWILAPEGQGKGYATEAVTAALEWADAELPAPEIAAIISHGNQSSIRVAEKAGFGHREDAFYKGEPILLFRRRR